MFNRQFVRGWWLSLSTALIVAVGINDAAAQSTEAPKFVDHSLLIAPEFPCTWPSAPFPRSS